MNDSKLARKLLKPRTDIAIRERYVSMSNAVARGAQGLSLSQKRVLALAMSMTDSMPAQDLMAGSMHGWTVRLNASDYAESYDVDADTAYTQLKATSVSLMKCIWRTAEPGARRGRRIITVGPWCTLAKYHDGEGVVDVTFHHYIAPHLLALRSEFTTYKLKQTAALRSVYSWRLFECLQSWKSTGRWTPDIAEFQKAMDAPASCVKDFGQLKRRILDPAIHELRDKQGVEVECKLVKAGRKVTGLNFTFQPAVQGRLNLDI